MKLINKVAIITGGSSGIGKAAAILFAKEGAKVVIASRSPEQGKEVVDFIRKNNGKAYFVKTDVSKEAEVKNLIDFTIKLMGRIDILYNNAGIDLQKPVIETGEQELSQILDINLKGVFYGCKYAIPYMIKSGGGAIINTASTAGLVGLPNMAAYCASKGGVIALTRQMAIDYARNNIRVNCICPGSIKTPMIQRYIEKSPDPEQAEKNIAMRHPLERIGKPEEIASAALFLASEDSSFVTGHALIVDGGLTAQ